MADLVFTSMVDLARMIATKEVSPVEVTKAHLDRIAARDAELRAYITVCAEAAREAARAAEAELMSGRPLGPLHGVPVALKDLVNTAGIRTTGGSKILGDAVPAQDATVAARLRAAGAVLLGKLNMHEFAYGPEGLNAHYGTSRNPWDAATARIPGGSSSGSGVAVAAGLAPGALGSDTGGSIRIPASLCGITGLKPTYGRVSRAGVLPLSWSLDHIGPMTRSAADCALMLRCLAGYDAADPTSSVLPTPEYGAALTGDVKGLRVGLLRAFFLESAAPEVRETVERAARALEGLGATVDEVALPHMDDMAGASSAILAPEALAYHAEWLRTRAADYQPDVASRLRMGAFVTGVQYVRAQQLRTVVRDAVDAALARRDVLLAPSTPIAATPVGDTEISIGGVTADVRASLIRFTRPFNFSGHPACSVPCGLTSGGLPIGMQFVGRPFDEATVLRVADAWQRATDWHARRPPMA
ncbi:MAG: Asp-tRNA(Asn)/Glu-tRNA(Gln) amidotransferase subunit GatA [Candidatus Rokubacteria bacterium]|nr:Asp-tRNA(Asn)/Glu-tRNA(Gln) amidotransferase subunit GatA [Candidatus Rokubacteria bacterium]MBI3825019.1 Asp-tRNA(Asn)/Glu-tRNA(Gln) amidotransferase subunit GatA [Candidatus Rokubacteria bacterium]